MKTTVIHFLRRAWPILLFPILTIIFLGDALNSKTLQLRDTFAQIAPTWQLLAERVRLGELPLWNPLIACGTPLLSNPFVSGFYPPVWIFFFTSATHALRLIWIIHLSLAGVGLYALCRQWKMERLSAILAGIAFAFGSMTVNCLECSPSLGSMALCPLVILFVERIVRTSEIHPERSCVESVIVNGTNISALALTLFLQLAAIAEWFYYSSVVVALYTAGRLLFFTRGRAIWLNFVNLAVAGVLSALLGSLVILPALEMVSGSVRAMGIDPSLDMASAHPRHWLSLLQPFLFGYPGYPDSYWAPTIYEFAWGSCYVGIAPLMFLPFAATEMFRRSVSPPRRFLVGFWVFILVGALLLIAGKYAPFYSFLHEYLPGMGRFRFPTKLYFIATLALAILSGLGFQAVRDRSRMREPLVLPLWLLGGLLITGFAIAFLATVNPLFFQTLVARTNSLPVERTGEILRGIYLALLFGGLTWAYLVFSQIRPKQALTFGMVIPALAFVDLWMTAGEIHPRMNATLYEKKPLSISDELRKEPVGRVFAPQAYCQQYIYGEDRPEILEWADNAGIGTRYTLQGLSEVRPEGLSQDAYVKVYGLLFSPDSGVSERAADLLGIRTVVISQKFEHVFWAGASKDIRIFKRSAPDRVRILSRWFKQSDPNATMNMIFSRNFDLSRDVVVDDIESIPDSPSSFSLWTGQEALSSGNMAVRSVTDKGWNRVEIEASNSAPAILVLNDTWAPGWKVRVDGVSRPIVRANLLFRGVFLNPGTHKLVFEYRPASLILGLTLFLTGLVICLALTVHSKNVRKLREPSSKS